MKQPDPPPTKLADHDVLVIEEHYLVVNKPPGVPVQATRDPNRRHLQQLTSELINEPVEVIHRLDVWTSGAVLLARTAEARRQLTPMFEQRTVEKIYEAVCLGVPNPDHGTMKHYLAKHRESGRDIMRPVRSGGKVAITDYRTLGHGPMGEAEDVELSLVELKPLTGRTHQLRAQALAMGWPILGDQHYRNAPTARLPGQLLHARSLTFVDPFNNTEIHVEAAEPDLFARYAAELRAT